MRKHESPALLAAAIFAGLACGTTAAAMEPGPDASGESLSPRALAGARLAGLDFLAGVWYSGEGANATWQMLSCAAGDRMVGVQEDVVEGASRFFEFQVYTQRGEHVIFLASPLGRTATPFVLIELGPERVVFENVHHDFPQQIVMSLDRDTLTGSIEGEEDGEPRHAEWRWHRLRSAQEILPHCAGAADP